MSWERANEKPAPLICTALFESAHKNQRHRLGPDHFLTRVCLTLLPFIRMPCLSGLMEFPFSCLAHVTWLNPAQARLSLYSGLLTFAHPKYHFGRLRRSMYNYFSSSRASLELVRVFRKRMVPLLPSLCPRHLHSLYRWAVYAAVRKGLLFLTQAIQFIVPQSVLYPSTQFFVERLVVTVCCPLVWPCGNPCSSLLTPQASCFTV